MEKLNEFADSWVKSQKEFMENWVRSQTEFMENWTESMKKMQEFFANMGVSQDGPTKEIISFYNSWLTSMVNSSKAFSAETEKIQQTWKNTIEKQMEMGKGMVKNFSESFKQAAEKK
jgi:hypothetical protein